MSQVFHVAKTRVEVHETQAFLAKLREAAAAGLAIELECVEFLGPVNLNYFRARAHVRCHRCRFRAAASLANAQFESGLALVRCRFYEGLSLASARINGPLELDRSVFLRRPADVSDRLWKWAEVTRPSIFAPWLRVTGSLSLHQLRAYDGINLWQASIQRDLWGERPRIWGNLLAGRAVIGGNFAFASASFVAGMGHVAVYLAGAEVNGSVFLNEGTRVHGRVDLRANVKGQINISNSRILAGRGERAVDLDAATVGGSVFFSEGTRVLGFVDLRANVRGQVNFSNARILAGKGSVAVDMWAATVNSSVFFDQATRIIGYIGLQLRSKGSIYFSNVRILSGRDKVAVNMQGAVVAGSIDFARDTKVSGIVDLRAKVLGNVIFARTRILAGRGKLALNMIWAEIGGAVYFHQGVRIFGRVELRAKIAGPVQFQGMRILAGRGETALNMESARIGGTVYFHKESRILGGVNLGARVRGQVNFRETRILAGRGHAAVTMDAAEIGDAVFLADGTWIRGDLSMRTAVLGNGVWATNDYEQSHFPRPGCCHGIPVTITGDWLMDFVTIRGPVFVHGAILGGRVNMRQAEVEGDVDFCGGELGRSTRDDWDAAFRAGGHGRYRPSWSSRHHRQTALDKTPWDHHFDFDLRHAHIQGRLWVQGQRVLGTVHLEDAQIDGEANFTNTDVDGDLILRSAKIVGHVFGEETTPPEPYPRVSGEVDARGAELSEVAIRFPSVGALPSGHLPKAIRLDGVTTQLLRFRGALPRAAGSSPVPLSELSVHQLQYDELDLGELAGGTQFLTMRDVLRAAIWAALVAIALFVTQVNRETAGAWWATTICAAYALICVGGWAAEAWRRSKLDEPVLTLLKFALFSPAFYLAVERKERATGNDPLADEVFLQRRKRELNETKRSSSVAQRQSKQRSKFTVAERIWRRSVLDFGFGYGVRPARALHLYLVLWLINWSVFLNPNSVERPLVYPMRPGLEVLAQDPSDATRSLVRQWEQLPGQENPWRSEGGFPGPMDWSAQNAFFMAMRLQLPILNLLAEGEWEPSDRAMLSWSGLKYENYAAVMQTFNLVLLPLLVAVLTGFLKRRE